MMKAPTLIFCLLASLSSLVYAVPFQRRQIGRLQECQAQLDKDVTTFTNTVSALDINLDITVVLPPILDRISGDYKECNSALENNGKLSDDQAKRVLGQYRSSSSTFQNGLDQMAARKNSHSPFIRVSASLSAFGAQVGANMQAFGGNVANNSPNDHNGANQKEAHSITSGLQSALQRAFN